MATDTLATPAAINYGGTKVFKNFIDGEWVESSSGETFENRNPADTRDLVGTLSACSGGARAVPKPLRGSGGGSSGGNTLPFMVQHSAGARRRRSLLLALVASP